MDRSIRNHDLANEGTDERHIEAVDQRTSERVTEAGDKQINE